MKDSYRYKLRKLIDKLTFCPFLYDRKPVGYVISHLSEEEKELIKQAKIEDFNRRIL